MQSSRKIGDANCNADKYNWGYYPLEVDDTLLTSEQTHTFSDLPTYDIWSLECIIYHLLFGFTLFNVDSQQINILLSILIDHYFHLFATFMLLLLSLVGIF